MSRADLDLKISAGIAFIAVLVATTVETSIVRALPCALLVLVVPGYVLSVALLPDRRDVFERSLLALGLSICVAVFTGLLVDRLGTGLTSRSLSIALALFTLGACILARRRRAGSAAAVSVPAGRGPWSGRRILVTSAMVVASLAAVIAAVLVARLPSSSAHIEGSTSLWIKPQQVEAGTFVVGVRSNELRRTTYRLVARSVVSPRILINATVTLAPGRQWQAAGRVSIPRNGTTQQVRVSLYKAIRPRVAYRHVFASFGTFIP